MKKRLILFILGMMVMGAGYGQTFTITASAGENGSIDPKGKVEVKEGDNKKFTFSAEKCYKVDSLLVDTQNVADSIDKGSYTFVGVTDNHTIYVTFKEDTTFYHIKVMSNPLEGANSLTGDGCYNKGDTATVEAFANSCYDFVNWTTKDSVFVSLENPYEFEVTQNDTLVANFVIKTFDVDVSANPTAGGDVVITAPDDSGNYDCGTNVTVTATPDPCYKFESWTENGEEVSKLANYTFRVTKSRELVANFEIKTFDVDVSANPMAGGAAVITAPDDSGNYDCGTNVTVTATPDSCYKFVNWTENETEVSKLANYTFRVAKFRELVANFEIKTFTISASVGSAGGGTVSDDDTAIECGRNITVTATPDSCYKFVNWTEGGNIVSNNPVYTIENIATNHTLVANFEIKHFDVTVSAEPSLGNTVSGGGKDIVCGTEVTLTATPDSCHYFVGWTEDGSNIIVHDPVYLFIATDDHTLTANFRLKPDTSITVFQKGTNILYACIPDSLNPTSYCWGYYDKTNPLEESTFRDSYNQRYWKFELFYPNIYTYFVETTYSDGSRCSARNEFDPGSGSPGPQKSCGNIGDDENPALPPGKIKVFPNPAKDELHIEADIEQGELQIIEIAGRVVMQSAIAGRHSKINISGLANGFYILIVKTEDAVLTAKFVVE